MTEEQIKKDYFRLFCSFEYDKDHTWKINYKRLKPSLRLRVKAAMYLIIKGEDGIAFPYFVVLKMAEMQLIKGSFSSVAGKIDFEEAITLPDWAKDHPRWWRTKPSQGCGLGTEMFLAQQEHALWIMNIFYDTVFN
jgi:hypothetical protein